VAADIPGERRCVSTSVNHSAEGVLPACLRSAARLALTLGTRYRRAYAAPLAWPRCKYLLLTAILFVGAVQAQPPTPQRQRSPTEGDVANATQTATEVYATEVYSGSDFWWKRTQEIEGSKLDPSWWSWIKDVIQWVIKAIQKFLSALRSLFAFDGSGSTVQTLFWIGIALVAAWACWRLVPRLWRWWQTRQPVSLAADRLPDLEELPEARLLLEQASAALRDGKYADALRYTFLATLAWLQARGALRYDPSRTNREYQHDLHKEPGLANVFGEVARPFERAWYGAYPAERHEAERVLALCRGLVSPQRETGS
jgi:hypothetical protein